MLGFIFDLDGTLADTMPAHFAAWQVMADRHGFAFPETRFYGLGGVPTTEIARILVAEAKLDLDPVRLAHEKEDTFAEMLLRPGGARPIEPVLAIARASRGQGPLAVASGGTRRLVDRTLALLGITDWFGAIVTAEDTVRHKPDPDVFLEAARRIGVPPAECTVYEDTDLGLEAALRAGMSAVDVRLLGR